MGSKSATAFLVLGAILFCLHSADAGFGFGPCSAKRNAIKDFKVDRYIGRWYEIGSFGAWFEWNGKCVQALYSFRADQSIEVVNSMKDKTTDRVKSIVGSAKPADKSGDGKLEVTLATSYGKRSGPYWVLGTDYENYAIVYACSDFRVFHFDVGWILSRRATLDMPYKSQAEKILADNDLKPSQFSTTVQDCGIIYPDEKKN